MSHHDCGYRERVGLILRVAKHHREKLLARSRKVNDPVFASGASWSIYAIDRLIMACEGETNLAKLGLGERVPSNAAVIQEALFGVAESAQEVERRCAGCGGTIFSRKAGRSPKIVHYGRGLCSPCYHAAEREGRLDDYNKTFFTRDELLDEWVILCRDGYTRDAAAARLKMKPESFKRALERARKDGDPRALLDRHQCALRNFAS